MIMLARLVENIRVLAAADPDFVYDTAGQCGGCAYAPNDRNACGCIVGEALREAGLPVEVLQQLDAAAALGSDKSVAWGDPTCRTILADRVTSAALDSKWIRAVQSQQDEGVPWADAVADADGLAFRHGWELA